MAIVEQYRQYVQQLLSDRAARSMKSNPQVEAQTVFDRDHDHYQLVYVGWKRNGVCFAMLGATRLWLFTSSRYQGWQNLDSIRRHRGRYRE